jgi:hypothetical protein
MSKRYFYTDPLAAAWMAKHHEMRFCGIGYPMTAPANEKDILGEYSDEDGCYQEPIGIFNIHPDSLHLLEPQVGDLAQFGIDNYGMWREVEPQYRPNFFGIPIIQRNGVAFMWPEVENANPA